MDGSRDETRPAMATDDRIVNAEIRRLHIMAATTIAPPARQPRHRAEDVFHTPERLALWIGIPLLTIALAVLAIITITGRPW